MKLTSEEGENVEIFNQKLCELLSKNNNAGPIPDNISIPVINTLLNASVPTFQQHVNHLYLTLASNPSYKLPDEIMSDLETLYLYLPCEPWLPSSHGTVTHQEFARFQQTCHNKMNKLVVKGSDNSNTYSNSGSSIPTTSTSNSTATNPVKCYDCGKPNVKNRILLIKLILPLNIVVGILHHNCIW